MKIRAVECNLCGDVAGSGGYRRPILESDFITSFVTTTPKSADYWLIPKWETTLRTNESILEHPWKKPPQFMGRFSATSRRRGNRIIRIYGAGDGNRTHVRSLGNHQR